MDMESILHAIMNISMLLAAIDNALHPRLSKGRLKRGPTNIFAEGQSMKTRRVRTLLVLPMAAMLLTTTWIPSQTSWQPPQAVRIKGAKEEIFAYFPSFLITGQAKDTGGIAGLLLRDGDLLAEQDSVFPYLAGDGATLNLTSKRWCTRLEGKTVSISLAGNTDKTDPGRKWLEKASILDLAAIRSILLPNDLQTAPMPALRRLATANPHVALISPELDKSNPVLIQALPLFRPHLLAMTLGDMSDVSIRRILEQQEQVDTLITDGSSSHIDLLRTIPRVRRLLISKWKVDETGPLPPGLEKLRSLFVSDSDMKDLAALGAAPQEMEELSLMGCEEIVDVQGLKRFAALKTLILNDCKGVLDLSSLDDLKQLQWVGLPPKISQEQFAAFVKAHPNLRILEVRTEDVTDLGPLRDLKNLEGLILGETFKNLDALKKLKSLRYVGLSEKAFKDSPDQVAALRKALPETLVVPAITGACLGSGWILLLLPTVVLWRFLQRRRATGLDHA
jgi:Leucine-rich repeat (LRR) protein